MFQAISHTPLRIRPSITHRGQVIRQKKVNTKYQITDDIIQRVLKLLKRNPSWYEKYNIHNPADFDSVFEYNKSDFYPTSWRPAIFYQDDEFGLASYLFDPMDLHNPISFTFSEIQ